MMPEIEIEYLDITLEKKDIQLGRRNQSMYCPWARAINRTLGLKEGSTTVLDTIAHIFHDPTHAQWRYTVQIPSKVRDWIQTYDQTGHVEAITMTASFRIIRTKEAGYLF